MLILAALFLVVSTGFAVLATPNFTMLTSGAVGVFFLFRAIHMLSIRKFTADGVLTNVVGFASIVNSFILWSDLYGPSAGVPHSRYWNLSLFLISVGLVYLAVRLTEIWARIHEVGRREAL